MKLQYLIFSILILSSCQKSIDPSIIAVENNKQFELQNIEKIKKQCNAILNKSATQKKLTKFKVLKDFDTNNDPKEYYYVLASTDDNSFKLARELNKKGTNLYYQDSTYTICYGCIDCFPRKFKNNQWGCDSKDPNILFDCKKNTTINE